MAAHADNASSSSQKYETSAPAFASSLISQARTLSEGKIHPPVPLMSARSEGKYNTSAVSNEALKNIKKLLCSPPVPPPPFTQSASASTLLVKWDSRHYLDALSTHQASVCSNLPVQGQVRIQFGLRHFRTAHTLTSSWTNVECKQYDTAEVLVEKLKSSTEYTMCVRCRTVLVLDYEEIKSPGASESTTVHGPWSAWSERAAHLRTLTIEEHERAILSERVSDFIQGELEPYNPRLLDDTIFAKAERVGGAALSAATVVLPGAYKNYAKIAKLAWSVRHIGLSAQLREISLCVVCRVVSGL